METNKIKIAVSVEEANLILLALAERANKLEKGALKTRNHFYAEFAADRAREIADLMSHDPAWWEMWSKQFPTVEEWQKWQ